MSFYARDQKENDVGRGKEERGGNEIRSRRLQRKEGEREMVLALAVWLQALVLVSAALTSL